MLCGRQDLGTYSLIRSQFLGNQASSWNNKTQADYICGGRSHRQTEIGRTTKRLHDHEEESFVTFYQTRHLGRLQRHRRIMENGCKDARDVGDPELAVHGCCCCCCCCCDTVLAPLYYSQPLNTYRLIMT